MEKPKWDIFIRICHWCSALLVTANYFVLEEGETAHEWAGYMLIALVFSRCLWGFVGPSNARFTHFFPTPSGVIYTLKHFQTSVNNTQGHTPLAGLMVLFLLAAMLATAVSGWMQTLDMFWGEDWIEETHEICANILVFGATIHIIAVVIIQQRYKLPLIRHMTVGK